MPRPFLAPFRVACPLLSLAVASAAWGASQPRPKILEVRGRPGTSRPATVLLQRGVNLREADVGTEIEPGEHVRTDSITHAVIGYPDGSKLTVYPGSDLLVQEAKGGPQSNELRSGRVLGEVLKKKEEASAAAGPGRKPIKFVIRTKTATMGVRGTEFVVSSDAATGASQFHTLEGTVEVASNPSALLGGRGVAVEGGKFVTASLSGLGEVRSFDRDELMRMLEGSADPRPGDRSASYRGGPSSASAPLPGAPVAAPVAPPPPPQRLPEAPKPAEPPPAVVERQKAEEEGNRLRMHLISFGLAAFVSESPAWPKDSGPGQPHPEPRYYRALSIAWTPIVPIPLPVLNPYLRGSVGALFFQNGSLNSNLVIREYMLYAGTAFLRPLFVEVGGGEQIWAREGFDSGVFGVNAGIMLSESSRLSRVFVGLTHFEGGYKPDQLRAGIGIQF